MFRRMVNLTPAARKFRRMIVIGSRIQRLRCNRKPTDNVYLQCGTKYIRERSAGSTLTAGPELIQRRRRLQSGRQRIGKEQTALEAQRNSPADERPFEYAG